MSKYVGGALIPGLRIDRGDRTPITMQLVVALREQILTARLPAGARLPASRTLAHDLGVSRTTAVNAYEQLGAEGLLVSTVGAGTFVSAEVRPQPAPRPNAAAADRTPRLARLSREVSDQYFPRLEHPEVPRPFVTGMPAFDAFPMALWARLSGQYWRSPRAQVMSYPDPAGLPALRAAVCQHLRANRGVQCHPDEVFICNGAQEAFTRIGHMLLDPGDPVWLENPGAIGARNSLLSCGAAPVPVPVDAQGLEVAAGLAEAPEFRLAFVTPAHQHPLGVTMSLDRRFELLAAAEAAGAWIIEDDYVGEFHYGRSTPPPLKSIDSGGRVIYVGTFSKALFPAVRLGYIVAPPALVPMFDRTLGAVAHGVSHAMQAIVARFIEDGHFAAHIRRMREIYAQRRDTLLSEAAQHLAGRMDVRPTDTGFHTIGTLPVGGPDETAVSRAAATAGLAATPLGRFALRPLPVRGVTLGFSAVPPPQIARGVRTLATVLDGLPGAVRRGEGELSRRAR
ncbi:aminotransferase class I/II-fold pyridoxal phosphate-dependent enzyme [Rhodobacteraceae bacterium 2CG4]|uniref:Aminotransferase class I/II-fold pyridoxal phosphate-dependent enzyme n=1 Tax=Halovulum marinum TaxID=2662447 RepID=A0A6L5Z1W2_9RHOB|nr:PLP-dependent aminotransferase family protein [Halovulum marinum]MSU90042.1 aminotransferase class I/II-fold pyridoxal phosphate-dependent enzyme [Halovulum marinum]